MKRLNSHTYIILLITFLFVACNSNKSAVSEAEPDKTEAITMDDKVQVLMKKGANFKTLEKKYQRYELKMLHRISKSQEKYQFSFNPESIGKAELVRILNAQSSVRSAHDPFVPKNTVKRPTYSTKGQKVNVSKKIKN